MVISEMKVIFFPYCNNSNEGDRVLFLEITRKFNARSVS